MLAFHKARSLAASSCQASGLSTDGSNRNLFVNSNLVSFPDKWRCKEMRPFGKLLTVVASTGFTRRHIGFRFPHSDGYTPQIKKAQAHRTMYLRL